MKFLDDERAFFIFQHNLLEVSSEECASYILTVKKWLFLCLIIQTLLA
jgi:hypothetical protein